MNILASIFTYTSVTIWTSQYIPWKLFSPEEHFLRAYIPQ